MLSCSSSLVADGNLQHLLENCCGRSFTDDELQCGRSFTDYVTAVGGASLMMELIYPK